MVEVVICYSILGKCWNKCFWNRKAWITISFSKCSSWKLILEIVLKTIWKMKLILTIWSELKMKSSIGRTSTRNRKKKGLSIIMRNASRWRRWWTRSSLKNCKVYV